ncbi:hypothetical protein G7054_g2404 [Neopestalotiopsis clavispora]|nr:hypothetical protein G7054_g2404 [Neopestalotiopsis clavispora]
MAGSLVLKLLVLLALGGSRLATANRDLHPPLVARNPPVPNLPMPQSVSKTPGSIINTCTKPGVVALAYDDGPGIYTDQLLDILRQNSIQVTFFVNGNNEDGPITEGTLPKTLKNTLLQGHQIGSHTWSHADLNSLTREERWEEMESLQEALANVTGFAPTYMRPPYFSCTDDCVQDMTDFGFRVVTADLDTKDFLGDYEAARNTYSNALGSADPKTSSFIVLVHDIHESTVNPFTQYMIDVAVRYGYKFMTVGECLGDPEINWYHHSVKTEKISGNSTINGTRGSTLNVAHHPWGWHQQPDCSGASAFSPVHGFWIWCIAYSTLWALGGV